MSLGEHVAHGDQEAANLLAEHFMTTFTNTGGYLVDALRFDAPVINDQLPTLDQPFEEDQVRDALLALDENKGAGPDGLPPVFWKKTASVMATPLTKLFNASLLTGVFPLAYVVVVHKSGLRSKLQNYQQISILSCPGKVLDKLMCQRVTSAFRETICEAQHGFLKGRSTTTNLIDFVSELLPSIEAGHQVDALYLDFSKLLTV